MEWLTIHEAAALLRVKVTWLYERTRTNSIPHVKLGKYLRFDRDELIAWVAEFKRDGGRAERAGDPLALPLRFAVDFPSAKGYQLPWQCHPARSEGAGMASDGKEAMRWGPSGNGGSTTWWTITTPRRGGDVKR